MHGRCAKLKTVSSILAKTFVFEICFDVIKGNVEIDEELSLYGRGVGESFCYLGDRLNGIGESKVALTARTRIGWIKFGECVELLYERKDILNLCKVGNVMWEREMSEGE